MSVFTRQGWGLTLLMAAVSVAMSVGTAAAQKGTLTDSRDGKKYTTVKIGPQTWMAENLNYQMKSGFWCYNNDDSKCKQYGRLYDWATALKDACPSGWKLPEAEDWDTYALNTYALETHVLNGLKLWDQRGGARYENGTFSGEGGSAWDGGSLGYWWTATTSESDSRSAYGWLYGVCCESSHEYQYRRKGDAYSVRCVQK